jgi:hypothetical protein
VILRIFTHSDTIPFCNFGFWLYHSCIHSLQDMVLYKLLTISGESRVFLITLDLQPYIHKEFDSCFVHDWTYLQFPVFFLHSIPFCSEGNIMDHISAIHNLTWCCSCLQCCMIGASNSLVNIQLIEESNQMDYLVALLDFHDFFRIKWYEHVIENFLYSLNDCICLWMVCCDL